MTMQSWVTVDSEGREVLVRTGTGTVTAVVGLGSGQEPPVVHRVEIDCEAPRGRARAIRYSTHGLVDSTDPLALLAIAAADSGEPMRWTLEWHRHPWIPADLPISSLTLTSDARAVLRELAPAAVLTDTELEALAAGESTLGEE